MNIRVQIEQPNTQEYPLSQRPHSVLQALLPYHASTMSWFTRLFRRASTPVREAAAVTAPTATTPTATAPTSTTAIDTSAEDGARRMLAERLAKTFCGTLPGAKLERFGEALRDDNLLSRITYQHEGVLYRLVVYAEDDGLHSSVFIETRCKGTFGTISLFRAETGETFEDDTPRFFLTPTVYAMGPRLANEIARVRMLPAELQTRLVALVETVERVDLADEVIAAHVGDLDRLADMLRSPKKIHRNLLAVGSELSAIVKHFTPIAHDDAQVIEARVCSFCGAAFIFAPKHPRCTRCGGAANNAKPMPPPAHIEIPDDALLSQEALAGVGPVMETNRKLAQELSRHVTDARIEEDAPRGRLFVTYRLGERQFRAKFRASYVGVRTEVKGALGDFFLSWSHQDVHGTINAGEAWRETERKIFFSKHCRVRSDHTSKEAARLASLPSEALRALTDMCEAFRSNAQLADGFLAQGMGDQVHQRGATALLECSRVLAQVADALPSNYPDVDALRYQVAACRHCRWEYFRDTKQRDCTHCGGSAD